MSVNHEQCWFYCLMTQLVHEWLLQLFCSCMRHRYRLRLEKGCILTNELCDYPNSPWRSGWGQKTRFLPTWGQRTARMWNGSRPGARRATDRLRPPHPLSETKPCYQNRSPAIYVVCSDSSSCPSSRRRWRCKRGEVLLMAEYSGGSNEVTWGNKRGILVGPRHRYLKSKKTESQT